MVHTRVPPTFSCCPGSSALRHTCRTLRAMLCCSSRAASARWHAMRRLLAADDESLAADASDRLASVAAAEAIIAKPVADQLRRLNVASTTDAAKRLAAATQLACQPDQVGAFARRKARLRPLTRL
jgi:flagellar biosynthesis/type III secretory pathway protein FliH